MDIFFLAALMVALLLLGTLAMRWTRGHGLEIRLRRERKITYYSDSEKAWHRQRWARGLFNGRHHVDFGYFLRRRSH